MLRRKGDGIIDPHQCPFETSAASTNRARSSAPSQPLICVKGRGHLMREGCCVQTVKAEGECNGAATEHLVGSPVSPLPVTERGRRCRHPHKRCQFGNGGQDSSIGGRLSGF